MKDLKGKLALVTGSSRGIGTQIAKGLASLGCDVILHARKIENLAETEKMLKDYNVKVYKIAAELSDKNQVETMLNELDKNHAKVDIVYNNAAIMCQRQDVFNTDRKAWDEVFEINVFALIKICEHYLPKMIKNNFGRIINFSSGIADQPELSPYALSKAAVDKYTKDMAIRLEGKNVLMNRIDPGWIKTDLGGPDAWEDLNSVLPGVLVPALLDKGGANGQLFRAQDYKNLELPNIK